MRKTTSPFILLRTSRIHNKGVFAKKAIPAGTKIIEYVGQRITKAESDRRAVISLEKSKLHEKYGAVYIFTLNKRHDIDGNVWYNTARFINHSCEPNCETEIIRGHIWIISLRDIKKGEEITYNYGYDLENYEEHRCRCGSSRCVGFIAGEEYWPTLKRRESYKARKLKNSMK